MSTFPPRALLWLARQVGAVLGLAALYFVAGRLALLLAIPPGYATAVWPAAGLALAAVLRFGYRLSIGVWLGSFLVNVWTSLDPGNAAAFWKSIAVAGGIGAGAAMQAALGAFLVRRFVGRLDALDDGPSVTKFLLLGGPVACLVNASVGVATLCVAGILARPAVLFSMATWWVGDTIGVLIFAPLGMLVLNQGPAARSRLGTILVPLGLTFAAVVALFFAASRWEQERLNRAFSRRADAVASTLTNNFGEYLAALHSIAALYGSSNAVEREEFAHFGQDLRARNAGIEALAWDPRVTAGQRPSFEAAGKKEGIAGFQITEFNAKRAIVRAADRAEFFPICFQEPVTADGKFFGFDVSSDPVRQRALRVAGDTGQPSATVVKLFSDPLSRSALIVYQPIYFRGAPHGTVEERQRNLEGCAAGVFRIREVMRVALLNLDIDGMQIRLLEDRAAGDGNVLWTHPEAREAKSKQNKSKAGPAQSAAIDLAGLHCVLECALTPEYLISQRSWVGWVVLAGGLALTSLLGGFLLVMTGRSARIEELVTQRTIELGAANSALQTHIAEIKDAKHQIWLLNADLERRIAERTAELERVNHALAAEIAERRAAIEKLRISEERFALAAHGTNDGIWDWNILTNAVYFSDRWCEIIGFQPGELAPVHESWASLIHPEDRDAVSAALSAHLQTRAPYDVEFRMRTKGGEDRWIRSRGEALWNEDGKPVRMAGSHTDITEQKRAEQSLRVQADLLDQSYDAILLWEIDGSIRFWNRGAEALYGFAKDEALGRTSHELLRPGHVESMNVFLPALRRDGKWEGELNHTAKDGRQFTVDSRMVVVKENGRNLVLEANRDITDRKAAEEAIRSVNADLERRVIERTTQLGASLAEKEVLLQEIHHRVKNNLQVVCGLLQLQAGQIKDQEIRVLFKESENRVRTMALVHQALYESDLANLDFAQYAAKLTSTLFRSYSVDPSRLALVLDASGVKVSADVAVPCGLIINELVTNALKYAFPNGRSGEIRVALGRDESGTFALSVSDNGIGFPPGVDFKKSATLGLKLVNSLAAQLGGSIEHSNGTGTSWRIFFKSARESSSVRAQ